MSSEYQAASAGTCSTQRAPARQKAQRFPQGRGADQGDGQLTVHDATYNLLRRLEMTTIFGNLGSTEQTFLKDFPDDFEYVLGLQEASAVAMADGFSQGELGLHAHVAVAKHDGSASGGHLLEAHVRPTLEVVLTESPTHLRRKVDPRYGIAFISTA